MPILIGVTGFDWDEGNSAKCRKHGVSTEDIEALFRAGHLAIRPDPAHSAVEERFQAVGRTDAGRHVFLVFTLRRRPAGLAIRPISARYMHDKEIQRFGQDNPDLQDR